MRWFAILASALLVGAACKPTASQQVRPDAAAPGEETLSPSVDSAPDGAGDEPAAQRSAVERAATSLEPEAAVVLQRALASSDAQIVLAAARGLALADRVLTPDLCERLTLAYVRVVAAVHEAPGPAYALRVDDADTPAPSAPDDTQAVGLARALGRCADSERVLLESRRVVPRAVAEGLFRRAVSQRALSDAAVGALLEAPTADAPTLRPLARIAWNADTGARFLARATAWWGQDDGADLTAETQALLARSLGHLGGAGIPLLRRIVARGDDGEHHAAHREALLALARLRDQTTLAEQLAAALPEAHATREWLVSPAFARADALVAALGEPPPRGELAAALQRVARLPMPEGELAAPLRARLERLRCAASAWLVGTSFDAAPLFSCAPHGSAAWEMGRVRALARSTPRGARLDALHALLQSQHLATRELALESLVQLTELPMSERSDAAAHALASAQAREVMAGIAIVRSLPPAVQRQPRLRAAFVTAAQRNWSEDQTELITALIDLSLDDAATRALAEAHACHAAWLVRSRAQALAGARECSTLHGLRAEDPPVAAPVRLRLSSPVGDLALTLDPAAAPRSVAAIVALTKQGFYTDSVAHRVVPGFVVQLGEPEAGAYGGMGSVLRHEPSAHGFSRHMVGLAHAGFDTASSQLFVTLGPAEHLDPDFTWLGTAEGPWELLVPGDPLFLPPPPP